MTASNHLLSGYNGTATLTATGQGGSLSVSPTSVTFTSGVWTGNVTVNAVDPTVTLHVTDPIAGAGASGTFATQPGPVASFQWSTVASTEYENIPFPVTVTAKDTNGDTATGYSGTANLSGLSGTTTSQTILGSPTPTNRETENWTTGYSFTPSSNFQVTAVRHYFGTKISIWTDGGVLLASQTYTNPAGSWTETPLSSPILLQAGVTYRVAAYSAGQPDYYRTDMSSTSPIGTIDVGYVGSGDSFPTMPFPSWWEMVDLRGNFGTFTSVPILPATATFTAGVWTGNVAVQQAETGLHLHVDDGAGQTGDSNTFAVSALPPVRPSCRPT